MLAKRSRTLESAYAITSAVIANRRIAWLKSECTSGLALTAIQRIGVSLIIAVIAIYSSADAVTVIITIDLVSLAIIAIPIDMAAIAIIE